MVPRQVKNQWIFDSARRVPSLEETWTSLTASDLSSTNFVNPEEQIRKKMMMMMTMMLG
jgi:hypothetical protein